MRNSNITFNPHNTIKLGQKHKNPEERALSRKQFLSQWGEIVGNINTNYQGKINLIKEFYALSIVKIEKNYLQDRDPFETAEQIADLRKFILSQAFLWITETAPANFALAVGGSMVKGDHTFKTDVDFVTIAASRQDEAAAQTAQRLMIKVVSDIGLEPDAIMPINFNGLSVEGLRLKFPSVNFYGLTAIAFQNSSSACPLSSLP